MEGQVKEPSATLSHLSPPVLFAYDSDPSLLSLPLSSLTSTRVGDG